MNNYDDEHIIYVPVSMYAFVYRSIEVSLNKTGKKKSLLMSICVIFTYYNYKIK